MTNKKANKKNEKVESDTFEMDLQASSKDEQGADEKSPDENKPSDLDELKARFPEAKEEYLKELLKDMPLNDAIFLLEEEKEMPQEEQPEPESEPQIINKANSANEQHGGIMSEETQAEKPVMNVDDKFAELMAEQDSMQKSMEKKAGGVVTVDDTIERAERATDIAVSGKRRGKKFAPNKGTAHFMVKQNAKYKASGKPAPYSKECIKQTLMREEA